MHKITFHDQYANEENIGKLFFQNQRNVYKMISFLTIAFTSRFKLEYY